MNSDQTTNVFGFVPKTNACHTHGSIPTSQRPDPLQWFDFLKECLATFEWDCGVFFLILRVDFTELRY